MKVTNLGLIAYFGVFNRRRQHLIAYYIVHFIPVHFMQLLTLQ